MENIAVVHLELSLTGILSLYSATPASPRITHNSLSILRFLNQPIQDTDFSMWKKEEALLRKYRSAAHSSLGIREHQKMMAGEDNETELNRNSWYDAFLHLPLHF